MLRSESMLRNEQSDLQHAQQAEQQLREALVLKKKEERRKVADTLRKQIQVKEKQARAPHSMDYPPTRWP